MKIAHIVPLMAPMPAVKYGGIERIAEALIMHQAQQGHKVVVYCSGESTLSHPNVELRPMSPAPTAKDLITHPMYEMHQFLSIVAEHKGFDFVHFHFEPIIASVQLHGFDFNLMDYITVPFLCSVQNTTYIDQHIKYYKSHKNVQKYFYNFISNNQIKPLKRFLPNSHVIYNACDVDSFDFNANPSDYLAFLGRITPEKGIIEAIQVAKATNNRLVIAAKIDKGELTKYYEREVKPLIDGEQIKYIGEVDHAGKVDLLRNAKAMLFPIQWNEPFGLVMIESMACGTPVVATGMGSVPEVVKDGVSGLVFDSVGEMISGLDRVEKIDRKKCREYVKKHFDLSRMLKEYDVLYKHVLENYERVV